MHSLLRVSQPLSKLVSATDKAVKKKSSAKKGGSNIESSATLLPVFSTNPVRVIFAAASFLLLVVGVFFVANHHAEKTARGFPNLQDYQIDLVDQDNKPQTVAKFAGKPVALFFGFTYCPDICPTTLTTLIAARDDLHIAGVSSNSLQIVFVTVDPVRDNPEQLKQYLGLFDAEVTGLTGTPDNIKSVLKQFGIYAKKTGQDDGEYLFDHSAAVFLYRGDGQFKGTIVHNEPFAFVAEKLKSIL